MTENWGLHGFGELRFTRAAVNHNISAGKAKWQPYLHCMLYRIVLSIKLAIVTTKYGIWNVLHPMGYLMRGERR